MPSRTKPSKSRAATKQSGASLGERGSEVARLERTRRAPAPMDKKRAGARPKSRSVRAGRSQHFREIGALVSLGIAAFLLFALIASESAGILGRGVRAGLVFAFGWLAYLVPVALLALSARLVFGVRMRRSRVAGVCLLLFGLFLFVAGAAPPVGEHGEALFVRHLFEKRAGGLGEALYAAVHGLTGTVGVGIISWIALLAGFVLSTGITGLWISMRARQAAATVRAAARRGTSPTNEADLWAQSPDDWPWATNVSGSGLDLANTSSSEILWGAEEKALSLGSKDNKENVPSAKAFDDWLGTRESTTRPLSTQGALRSAPQVIDGARVFADLFASSGQSSLSAGKGQSSLATGVPGASLAHAGEAGGGSDVSVSGPGQPEVEAEHGAGVLSGHTEKEASTQEVADQQQAIPGLEQTLTQAVDKPARPVWVLPEPYMLQKSPGVSANDGASQRERAAVLVNALAQFGVEARVVGMVVGPRVTRYELQLAPGTKVAKVSALKDDLAYALATTDIRILTPIPGKSAVGVEIPNLEARWVTLGDIYQDFPRSAGPLMFWLGKDISGKPVYADLTRLPHLLIAGTTGSGKSGCVNCIVSSILLRATPDEVRMIMIDPKKVELSHYDRIPHLLVPVVTNMKDAAGVLHNVVKEMEDRYELMELDHARSLPELNKARARRGERPLPYILIVIDELADLMMTSPQEVEDYVIRIAQKARAVGIHLVVATQRPSADVITGMIKANIPSRIAFAVSSQVDSRVILDANGAETLLGAGDMLFKPLGSSHMQRVQGALITEEEIAILVAHWRRQAEPEFREELLRRPEEDRRREEDLFDPDADDLLPEAARLVIETGNASVSMLQRRLRVGYTRAGRLIDMLERRGIVGPWEGSKPRQILVLPEEVDQVVARLESEQKSPARREPE
ncbi:MAG: DNA translocase FtsK [Thermoleophilia bacterium]|nr:DNA translocase FtsK [Thermoleophilia bacterium]